MKLLPIATIALSASQATALSSKDVVQAIDDITDLSSKTNDIAKDLKPENLVQNLPKLTNNFKDIVTMALKDVKTLTSAASMSDFKESDQTDICKSFHGFVTVHQNLLRTIIGQNGILSKTPLTVPLAAVLRVLEGGVDKLAEALIGTVPTCKDRAMKDLKALDGTLDETVTKLSNIFPGGSGGLGGAVNNAVGGLTGSIGNGLAGLAGGSKDSNGGKAGGLLGGLAGRGLVPTSLVTSVTGKAHHVAASATKGLDELVGTIPTAVPHGLKGGSGGLADRGLEDPAGPLGNKVTGLPSHIMGDPTDLISAVSYISETDVPMPTLSNGKGGMKPPQDLAERQLGGLNDAKGAATGAAKGAASAATGILGGVMSKATGLLSAIKPTSSDSGALPAASDALGQAEGGVSDGSTGGLLGGLIGPKGGKGGKAGAAAILPKRSNVQYTASMKGNCTDKVDKSGKMGKMEKRNSTEHNSKYVEATEVANLIKFMADNMNNMPAGAMTNEKFPEVVESIKQISQKLAANPDMHFTDTFNTAFNEAMKKAPFGKIKSVGSTATASNDATKKAPFGKIKSVDGTANEAMDK